MEENKNGLQGIFGSFITWFNELKDRRKFEIEKSEWRELMWVKYKTYQRIRENKKTSKNFEFEKKQTPNLCLNAVRAIGLNLRFVKDQTPRICVEAVRQDPEAFRYVHTEHQTEEMCIEAVKNADNGFVFCYVKNPSERIYI